MTATTNGASPAVSAAPPDDVAARQVGDQRIDRQALDGYLNAVFGDGTGYAHLARGIKPYLTESGRYAFGRNWREDAFAWPAQRTELVKTIEQAVADDADVYLCPYLMKGEKRTKGTAVERRLAHADIDGEIDVAKVTQLGGFAISSGSEGHGHAYVALSAPVDARQHETLCRALGSYVGNADSKVSDNDVLRPPGTVNRKPTVRGGQPLPVRWLVETVSRRLWDPTELAAVLGIGPTATAASAPAVGPVDVKGLDEGVREALRLHIPREDGSGDDRSRLVFRVLQACYRSGMDLPQAEAAVRTRADLTERLDENPRDLQRVWIKVIDQAQRQR